MTDENPPEQRHREGLHQPIDEERHPDALYVAADLSQCAEVDFHQHRNDHDPDEKPNGKVYLSDRQTADELEDAWQRTAECYAHDDAEKYPNRQIALEDTQGVESDNGNFPIESISSLMRS
jgi:hypothetical protein